MKLKKLLTVLLIFLGYTAVAQTENGITAEPQSCIVSSEGCITLPDGEIENTYIFDITSFDFSNQDEASKFAGFHSSNLHKIIINLDEGIGLLKLALNDAHALESKEDWSILLNQRCH